MNLKYQQNKNKRLKSSIDKNPAIQKEYFKNNIPFHNLDPTAVSEPLIPEGFRGIKNYTVSKIQNIFC